MRLKIPLPKNIGDIVYAFRYRSQLPIAISSTALPEHEWLIKPDGMGRYRFEMVRIVDLAPNNSMIEIKIPDATPGIVAKYALGDEQALLAKLRYNRLIDIFTGVTCYSLQNHLRSNVSSMGQVETDEIYLGIDRRGVHYVLPVQAKGGRDKLSIVQLEQDTALCASKFPGLICRPIGAQFVRDRAIVLFELDMTENEPKIVAEKHYVLVPPDDVYPDDLSRYGRIGE